MLRNAKVNKALGQKGFQLVEVVIAASIGLIISMSLANITRDIASSTRAGRTAIEYVNLINEFRETLNSDIPNCGELVFYGTTTYDGNEKDLNQIQIGGIDYVLDGALGGSGMILKELKIHNETSSSIIAVTERDPVTNVEVVKNLTRRITNISITGERPPNSNMPDIIARKPVMIPVILVTDQGNNNLIMDCGGEEESMLCAKMGGTYISASADGTVPARCDILDDFGGCQKGGSYSSTGPNCNAPNPYTGTCGCPDPEVGQPAWVAVTTGNYNPGKGAEFIQKECIRCKVGMDPQDVVNIWDPAYSDESLSRDLNCIAGTAACPCADPNSTQCLCSLEPTNPACSDPCAVYGYTGCDCYSARMSHYSYDTTSAQYQQAVADYYAMCFNPYYPYY